MRKHIYCWLALSILSTWVLPGQVNWALYGGINYAWTQLRILPENVAGLRVRGVNPMYGPEYGLRATYRLQASLEAGVSLGYAGMGYTGNYYEQQVFHFLPLRTELLFHAEQAPDWLRRLSLGGGAHLQLALNKPRQTLFPYSAFIHDPRWVYGVHGRVQYALGQQVVLAVQYLHALSPYTRSFLFDGQVETQYRHRAVIFQAAYRIGRE